MIDLGLYNYVARSLSNGKSEDDIRRTLSTAQWKVEDVEQAIMMARKGKAPTKAESVSVFGAQTRPSFSDIEDDQQTQLFRTSSISAVTGFHFISWILTVINTGLLISVARTEEIKPILQQFVPWQQFNEWRAMLAWAATLLSMLAIIIIWRMKRWGVYLYTLSTITLAVLIFVSLKDITDFNVATLLAIISKLTLPAIVLVIGYLNVHKMH
jgi:hypothetical protein